MGDRGSGVDDVTAIRGNVFPVVVMVTSEDPSSIRELVQEFRGRESLGHGRPGLLVLEDKLVRERDRGSRGLVESERLGILDAVDLWDMGEDLQEDADRRLLHRGDRRHYEVVISRKQIDAVFRLP